VGASDFAEPVHGFETAREAFEYITKESRWEHGHGGYTGEIAEKTSFKMVHVPEGEDPIEYAEKLMDDSDMRYCDKWGPCGCVEFIASDGRKAFYFFGMASS